MQSYKAMTIKLSNINQRLLFLKNKMNLYRIYQPQKMAMKNVNKL